MFAGIQTLLGLKEHASPKEEALLAAEEKRIANVMLRIAVDEAKRSPFVRLAEANSLPAKEIK